jgi:hypothetical protein
LKRWRSCEISTNLKTTVLFFERHLTPREVHLLSGIATAQSALEKSQREHDRRSAKIEAGLEALDKKSKAEDAEAARLPEKTLPDANSDWII